MIGPPLQITLGFFTLLTVGLVGMGVAQPERRALFFVFAGMVGLLTLLMAIVFLIVYRTIPQ